MRWGYLLTAFRLMRRALPSDIPLLVTMMTEFYSDSHYTLNPRRATDAFMALLADDRLGHVWFIQSDSRDVGYVVLTLCHSMTFGGLVGVVDDFFIRPAFRGAGLGKAAMAEVRSYCATKGIRAIHVETGRGLCGCLGSLSGCWLRGDGPRSS